MSAPSNLPTPNAEEVERFKRLFLKVKGVPLCDEEAYDQALRLVQYVFLVQHALPRLRRMKRERDTGGDGIA